MSDSLPRTAGRVHGTRAGVQLVGVPGDKLGQVEPGRPAVGRGPNAAASSRTSTTAIPLPAGGPREAWPRFSRARESRWTVRVRSSA